MAHREGIRESLKHIVLTGTVLDWGAGTKPINNYLKSEGAMVITVDKMEQLDMSIVADLEQPMSLGIEADMAFCLEVLEHVWDTRAALSNIYNHLKDGGLLYASLPFFYPVHKEDDYHRYTLYGLYRLFREMKFRYVDISITGGEEDQPWGYVVKAVK